MSVNIDVPITSGAGSRDAIIRISGTFCARRPVRHPPGLAFTGGVTRPGWMGHGRLRRRSLNRGRMSLTGDAAGARDFHEDRLMRRLIRPALFVLLLLCLRLPDF